MALSQFGTSAATVLSAMTWTRQPVQADVASIAANILNDLDPAHPIFPGAFGFNGRLYIPNRGFLNLQPGDVVAYDDTGWPVLVSANSIAHGSSWTLA